jgi:hypothetical protein
MTGARSKFKRPSPIAHRWEFIMRRGNRFAWVMIVLAFTSTTALAQQGGGNGGGGQGGGGQGGGGQGGGLGSGGQGGGGQGGMSTGTPLIQLEQAPQISAPGSSTTGGTGTGGADPSNFLSGTYGNPYFQGLLSNAKSGTGPGGFGSPLYGTATGGAGGRGGIGGATGGRAGIGARGGLGGRGLGGAGQDGVIVPLPVSISYPAIATFPVAPPPTSQLQVEISGMIARTRELTNPAAVTATVDKGIVTLSGTVRDIGEAKTLASMIRLTPGVRQVKNDLTVAKP